MKGVESGVNTGNKVADLFECFAGCFSPAFTFTFLDGLSTRKSFAVCTPTLT